MVPTSSSPSAAPASAETTEAARIRVDTLSFCRLECDHSELFQPEYKRSNRTKGLKILRCFPHCCPNHIDRSYCGSSLHVIVQTEPTSASTTRTKLADNMFLFARFECSSDAGLQVGDTIPSSAVVRDTQSEENPEGTWIPGIKERASTLSSAMKSVVQAINENTLVYQLNGKVYSRWYYDWESGANKAQRLMRHVLKAYVFERPSGEDRGSSNELRVLGVVSSPEFTVISYRRAPNEGGLGIASEAKEDATTRQPSPSGNNSNSARRTTPELERPDRLKRTLSHTASHHHSSSALDDPMDGGDGKRRRRSSGSQSTSSGSEYQLGGMAHGPRTTPVVLRDATPQDLFEDRVLWEHAHASVVTVSKNLALVFYFIKWTPVDYYASFVDELVHLLNYQLLEPLIAPDKRLEKLNFFARVLLQQAQTQPTSRYRGVAPPIFSRELQMLLRTMAQAATWFFSAETRQWTQQFVDRYAHTLTDKSQLRAAFLEWVLALEGQLNAHVFAKSPLQTLANAAEEIIAAVYTHELYHPKRPVIRQILGENGFLGWRPFVAQMRDAFIDRSLSSSTRDARRQQHQQQHHQLPPLVHGLLPRRSLSHPSQPPPVSSNPLESAWNGEWVLDTDESSWNPRDAAHPDGLALVTMLDFMTQLTRIHVTLQADQRVLSISSRASFSTASGRDGMKLVLDGKSRVFRVSAHGLSTAINEGADGDYIGSTRMESSNRLIAYLETFRWSKMPGTRSYHVRMRITYAKEKDQPRLWVTGDVLETIAPMSFSSEELQYMPELKIAAKMKAVNRVFVRQPALASSTAGVADPSGATATAGQSNGNNATTAWRRLGGFRLNYFRSR